MIQIIKNLIFEVSVLLFFTSRMDSLQLAPVIERYDVIGDQWVGNGRRFVLR